MPNVLIVYGTSHGQTRKIARRIEEHLVARGIAVEAHDVRNLSRTFQVSQYDGVIVGGRIWMSKVPKNLREFVRGYRPQLESRPSALFSVCLAVLNTTPEAKAEVAGMLPKFEQATGWRPLRSVIFAGALPYTRYNFFLRWVMKRIATMAGRDTDTSRDYEYTDWDEVARFAEDFADQMQPRAPVQPEARAAAVSPL
jgi:menaquinone-dependent protoporphyrinogen oxidase